MNEITRLARDLERHFRGVEPFPNGSEPVEPAADPVAQSVARIEEKIDRLLSQMAALLDRLPPELPEILAELRQLKAATPQMDGSDLRQGAATADLSPADPAQVVKTLTRQERQVFALCFQSGPLTYRELGERLDISPVSAKNSVNRIANDARKRLLLRKEIARGTVRVAISHHVEGRILKGKKRLEQDEEAAGGVFA